MKTSSRGQTDKALTHRSRTVDAHHHLWQFKEEEFGWISDSMSVLRRDYLMPELAHELATAQVDATVVVQARESLDETRWLLQRARETSLIQGVVGWAPLAADDLSDLIDSFGPEGLLVGIREVIQGRPDGYMDQENFDRGIRQLTQRGLSFDVLIFENQMEEAIRLVDRHPHQRFVVDHAGKPKIRAEEMEPWRSNLRALSKRPNVACKISGLVTEDHWNRWTLESLKPYLGSCVEAFGAERLMAGSDWPVCLVAASYTRWWTALQEYFREFSRDETAKIFGETAIEFYGLPEAF